MPLTFLDPGQRNVEAIRIASLVLLGFAKLQSFRRGICQSKSKGRRNLFAHADAADPRKSKRAHLRAIDIEGKQIPKVSAQQLIGLHIVARSVQHRVSYQSNLGCLIRRGSAPRKMDISRRSAKLEKKRPSRSLRSWGVSRKPSVILRNASVKAFRRVPFVLRQSFLAAVGCCSSPSEIRRWESSTVPV
jgi:hypothetical protein